MRIAVLAGWDSDNPAATWGGLLGFISGRSALEESFGQKLSDRFHIGRTRAGFGNDGMDDFPSMAQKGVDIIDNVVTTVMGGQLDPSGEFWLIPIPEEPMVVPATRESLTAE